MNIANAKTIMIIITTILVSIGPLSLLVLTLSPIDCRRMSWSKAFRLKLLTLFGLCFSSVDGSAKRPD